MCWRPTVSIAPRMKPLARFKNCSAVVIFELPLLTTISKRLLHSTTGPHSAIELERFFMRSDSIWAVPDCSKPRVLSVATARPQVGPQWKSDAPPRIHFLYDLKNHPWGGANQFLKALIGEMERKGARSRDASASDAIL